MSSFILNYIYTCSVPGIGYGGGVMKTKKHWIDTLPEPYKAQALENITSEGRNTEEDMGTLFPTQASALAGAFTWQISPQGGNYWAAFEDTLTGFRKFSDN